MLPTAVELFLPRVPVDVPHTVRAQSGRLGLMLVAQEALAPLGRLFCLSSVLTMQYSLAREIGLALAPSPGEFGARRHGVAVRAVCGMCRAAA